MKKTAMIGLVVAGLIISSAATSLLAQNGPRNGRGYGGPPKSEQERIARQGACMEKNGGLCPNGGPRAVGECQGKGAGKGTKPGGCDGSGPRSANGNCRFNTPAQPKK